VAIQRESINDAWTAWLMLSRTSPLAYLAADRHLRAFSHPARAPNIVSAMQRYHSRQHSLQVLKSRIATAIVHTHSPRSASASEQQKFFRHPYRSVLLSAEKINCGVFVRHDARQVQLALHFTSRECGVKIMKMLHAVAVVFAGVSTSPAPLARRPHPDMVFAPGGTIKSRSS